MRGQCESRMLEGSVKECKVHLMDQLCQLKFAWFSCEICWIQWDLRESDQIPRLPRRSKVPVSLLDSWLIHFGPKILFEPGEVLMGSAPHTVITRGEWLGHGVKQHHLMRAKIEHLNSVLFCYLSTWQILVIHIHKYTLYWPTRWRSVFETIVEWKNPKGKAALRSFELDFWASQTAADKWSSQWPIVTHSDP